ncbi:hypothetical protein EYZ66_11345 [Aequoribacter fuscus]|nr:hypothetical protein EYZ66_11345 [Aequoribacter fuscus]
MLVAGCWLLVAGCWLLVAGCWLLVAGCWLLVAGCWLLVVSIELAHRLVICFANTQCAASTERGWRGCRRKCLSTSR